MKISLEWLRDHLDLRGMTTVELSDQLTFAGVEVEDTVNLITRHGNVMASFTLNQHQPVNEFLITANCERGGNARPASSAASYASTATTSRSSN